MVDKDVQSLLWPLNLMQCIMFYPKYRIKNDLITPNSQISNFISMIATIVFSSLFSYTSFSENPESLGFPTFTLIANFNNSLLFGFGFCMNFVIEVIQTKNNVQFVLTFQNVHRFLNKGANVNHFIIGNWILGIMALSYYVIIFTSFAALTGACFSDLFVCYFLVVFDFNIVYATRLVKLLEKQVSLWSIQVLNSRGFEDTQREDYYKKAFQVYVEILECYSTCKLCFQKLVSNFYKRLWRRGRWWQI